MIAHLACVRIHRLARLDAALGELSYPIYLLHYQAGMVLLLAGLPWKRGDTSFMLAGAMATLLLSWLVVNLLDPVIHRLRNHIRPQPLRSP